jgi:hypothetical protein
MHAIHAKGAFHFLQANADKIQIVRVAMTMLMVGLGLDMHAAPGRATISLQTYFIVLRALKLNRIMGI